MPWAQRLRTCCTDRLIIEWSAPSALIVPAGRQRGAPGGAARRVSQAASSPPGRHRGALAGEAWAAGGTAAPAQGPRRAAGARHATRPRSRGEVRADRQPAGAGRETRLIAGTRDEAAAHGSGARPRHLPPACRSAFGSPTLEEPPPPPATAPGRAHARVRSSAPPPPGERLRTRTAPAPRARSPQHPPARTAVGSQRPPAAGRRERRRRHWRHRRASLLIGCSEGTASTPLAPSRLRAPRDSEPVSWAGKRATAACGSWELPIFFLERALRSSRSFPLREGIREQLFCKSVNANVL